LYTIFLIKKELFTVMPRAKNPRAVKRDGLIYCPVPGCGWSCTVRNSYSRHYDAEHRLSFKFICEYCWAGQDRRDLAEEHAESCRKTREANMTRRGRKPRFAIARQARAANPADPEEAVQELEEQLEEKERQNQQLLVEMNQMQVEKDQMEVEKDQMEVEKEQLQEKFDAVMREKEELKAKLKELEEHAMDVIEPELDEQLEEGDNDLNLVISEDEEEVLSDEVGEVLEDELEQDKEGMEDEGGDQPPALPSPPGLPLRRSERKSLATLLREKQEAVEAKILVTDDARHGLVVVDIDGKGRGVEASRPISKGDFVVEYTGELVDAGSGHAMEVTYSMDMTKGSYSYYFTFHSTKYCVDATEESGRFGRLLNHSRKHPTCVPKVVEVAGTPRLIFLAKHDIKAGQEITFDYGDRSKESLSACPWRAL
jgi:histone-lysine N-methyltransferase SETD8